jgi:hypothetical protein
MKSEMIGLVKSYQGDVQMKKILLFISLVFLVGCSAAPAAEETTSPDSSDQAATISEQEGTIAVLEYQIKDLTEELASLQMKNDTLLAASDGQTEGSEPANFLCEDRPSNIRYDSTIGTIAIVEGWFATQPFVQEMQGTYSTTFWNDVKSRIHTIRYISTEDGLTTTATFLIMFDEAGWQPGVLWMNESCWLDYPY